MPITTYLNQKTLKQATDQDICEALAALPQPPIVKEDVYRRSWAGWLRNRYCTVTEYSVLWPLGDTLLGTEYQVVNFYRAPPHTSINTTVPKELVLAYLYGCAVHRNP